MEWSVRKAGHGHVVAPVGRLEATMCDTFLANVTGVIGDAARSKEKSLTLDLAAVTNISPEGLRVLTLVKQVADDHHVALSIMRPSHRLKELLAISHLDSIFDVRSGDDA